MNQTASSAIVTLPLPTAGPTRWATALVAGSIRTASASSVRTQTALELAAMSPPRIGWDET